MPLQNTDTNEPINCFKHGIITMHMKIHFLLFALSAFSLVACGQSASKSAASTPASAPHSPAPESRFEVLDAASYAALLDQKAGAMILDVRTPNEYASGHIPGAVNMDFYAPDFSQRLESLDKTRECFIYCASGNRSGQAIKVMQQAGFRRVVDLKGGFGAWARAGKPVER